jgi:aromatic-L-amino-acid/L-tryptophan decarboxylase
MASGIVSEMLAAALNSNCGGRDHGALYVERCVLNWCKQLFGYGEQSSGLLVSGTSMATLVALTVARNALAGGDVRREGLHEEARKMVAYTSVETHESVLKALEMLGLGGASLRRIPVDGGMRIDTRALRAAVAADRQAGLQPFCVVGSAGTVNTGAIDDLAALADFCRDEKLWFHVDGAFGALCVLSEELRPLVRGIERADSIAFDFHKWMYVQYDAGCVLVKSAELHRDAFSMRPAYLAAADRGLAGGGPWFCEYGPELSRGFRALKVWFALKEHGTRKLGQMVRQNYRQARYLAQLIGHHPELELSLEPSLNIVCFRFAPRTVSGADWDALNRDIVADLQEAGIAAPSTTRINGNLAIRVAITNHRSRREDFQILVQAVLDAGRRKLRS